MRIDFFFNGIEISPYTREQVNKKLDRITNKIPNNIPIKVSFDDIRNSYKANVQVSMKQKELIGKGESKNILSSLEQAISKVDRQFQKYHEKRTEERI